MKKDGILNPGLLAMLGSMGHTDYITIADRGFPIPLSQTRLDLSVVDDLPTVLDVLSAINLEFQIDRVIVTDEMKQVSPARFQSMQAMFPNLRFDAVPHLELKALCKSGKGAIRTGDTCPYANLIVVSG